MKKFISIVSIIALSIPFGFSQQHPFVMSKNEMKVQHLPSVYHQQVQNQNIKQLPEVQKTNRDVDIVNIIDIGTSSTISNYTFNLSNLWVDPVLNTVINIHNMGGNLDLSGNSNDIGYDISKDGGMTWENMIEVYNSSIVATRFPQACVFNTEGNTNPDNAYVSYFATMTDVANYWDYVYGVGSIGDTTYHTQSGLVSNERFYQGSPKGFDITGEGKIFVIDENTDWTSGEFDYRDSLIITKGTWDSELEDFTYTSENLEASVTDDLGLPVDCKVAFGPNGQTGYIVLLGDNGEAEQIEGFKNLYPIYWKTNDAGETWDGPHVVQLDGLNGVSSIVENQLTDLQISDLFGDNPPQRDEISYTTAFDCEIAVDKDDRLHIAVVIGPTGSDPYSIITASDFIKAYDLFLYNENEPFCGVQMGSLRTFRGQFGDLTCDNRIQITTNPEHDRMFISWLDTDFEEETDNNRPNIWCRGFDPFYYITYLTENTFGEDAPTNVTNFSEGMWQAYFATAPKYTLDNEENWTIPYTYIEMDLTDPFQPIQFKYIQDFSMDYYDWPFEFETDGKYLPCGWVGIEEKTTKDKPLYIVGNSPNPFHNKTTVKLEVYKTTNVKISVTSATGQQLLVKDFGKLFQGSHDLKLQLSKASSGVYFYTVTTDSERVTKKMVVE